MKEKLLTAILIIISSSGLFAQDIIIRDKYDSRPHPYMLIQKIIG